MLNQDFSWILLIIALIYSLAPTVLARKDPTRRKAVDSYARELELRVTDDSRPTIIARIRTYERASLIGAAVGSASAFVTYGLFAMSAGWSYWQSALTLSVIVGMSTGATYARTIGPAVGAAKVTHSRRIARTRVPALRDYVPTFQLVAGATGPFFSLLTLILGPLLIAPGQLGHQHFPLGTYLLTPGALFTAFSLIAWVLGIRICGAVLDTGQPSGTERELAWDDGLRSKSLRAVAMSPFYFGLIGFLFTYVHLATIAVAPPQIVVTLGAIGVSAILGAAAFVVVYAKSATVSSQHFKRRLWAESDRRVPA